MSTIIEEKYRIIGITGKKFSGKDTLGSYFVNKYNYIQLAYAEPLKKAVKCIFDFDDEQLYGSKKEEIDEFWNVSPRKTLQFVGTNLFRNHIHELYPKLGKDIWVEVIKRKILNTLKKDPNSQFVITDVRFHNEAQLVKELGGTVIKLYRQNSYTDDHESEALIESIPADYVFENTGTKDDLYEKVSKTLNL